MTSTMSDDLLNKVIRYLQADPSLGYRRIHQRCQSEGMQVSLKKVQHAVQRAREQRVHALHSGTPDQSLPKETRADQSGEIEDLSETSLRKMLASGEIEDLIETSLRKMLAENEDLIQKHVPRADQSGEIEVMQTEERQKSMEAARQVLRRVGYLPPRGSPPEVVAEYYREICEAERTLYGDAQPSSSHLVPSKVGKIPECLQLEYMGDKGQGLIAATPIKKGALIMTEMALLWSSKEHPRERCFDIMEKFKQLGPVEKNVVEALMPSPKDPEQGLLGKIRNNVFCLTRGVKPHSCIFPITTRFNHSCVPNAQWMSCCTDDGPQMKVHALNDIEEGEEVCLSYIPVEGSFDQRQAALSQRGFACKCLRCTNKE